jgi:Uma2 family endonuclease
MSAVTQPLRRLTVEEYLAAERRAAERSVYIDGQTYLMAGASDAHGIITVNLVGLIFAQLRGTPCQARTKDTKVRSGPVRPQGSRLTRGMFSYPDVLVVCGEPQYHDEHRDVVVNPTAIFEVLSESTEAFDRGNKFVRLREWNPTLRDYVLVWHSEPRVEHYTRQADGSWSLRDYAGLVAVVTVQAIGCTLKLAEVYERVAFPTADEAAQAPDTPPEPRPNM